MTRVFVSSTSRDLIKHREKVKDAILGLGMQPVMMEHFPAMDADAVSACKQKVLDCDLFVGIYAYRYGYMPQGADRSITEMEYDWAKEAGIPIRPFVADQTANEWRSTLKDLYPDLSGDDLNKLVETGANADKLKAFRNRMGSEKVWATFTSPDSLAAAISQSLAHDAERLTRRERQQRRLLQSGFGIIAVLLIAIVAAVLLSAIDETAIADRQATNQARASQEAGTATAEYLLIPTPLEGERFAESAVGVVLAEFLGPDDYTQETRRRIERQFEQENVPFISVSRLITSREQARLVGNTYNATIIIWGERFESGVEVFYEITPRRERRVEAVVENVAVSADLENFSSYIFEGMDVLYVVNFVQGQILYFEENYSDALTNFDAAVGLIPVGWERDVKAETLYFYHGVAHQQFDNFEVAIADFTHAIELDPAYAAAYNNRGIVYRNQGDLEAAIADYTRAIELDPAYVFAYHNRGLAYRNQGDLEAAIADYSRAIELDPDYPGTYINRGNVYDNQGNVEAAIAEQQCHRT